MTTRDTDTEADPVQVCPDGGTCHHDCRFEWCFRVRFCDPLSGVYPDNRWPDDVQRVPVQEPNDG